MKIVTAGHRGSVATGEEIRGAHNNRRRIFSYSLVLLFSVLGAAQGAKLCLGGSAGIFSITKRRFAFGDCQGWAYDINSYPTSTADWPFDVCTDVAGYGIATLTDTACTYGSISASAPIDNGRTRGGYCWCRRLAPNATDNWLCLGETITGDCPNGCQTLKAKVLTY